MDNKVAYKLPMMTTTWPACKYVLHVLYLYSCFDTLSVLPSILLAFYVSFICKYPSHNILSINNPSQITALKQSINTVHDFSISSLQLSRSRLWRFRASSGKYALLYGLSLSVVSLPGSFLLPVLRSISAWARLFSSASLCKRSARNLSMELEKTGETDF